MYITIGEIIKAQGIKGELKIKPLTDDVFRFKKLKQVFINGLSYEIKGLRLNGGFVYLTLDGISDRTKAEFFVGVMVEIDRINAVDLPENTYFIADIIGCDVFMSDKTCIGKVDYIYQNGAADVYEVKGERNVMFPFLNSLIVSIDIDNKKIIVDKDEFNKVAVYED